MKTKLLFISLAFACTANAQTINIIASGLHNPIGICRTDTGALYVAEQGTGNNDGKIDVIYNGTLDTLITGLPSSIDTVTGEATGPYRAIFHDSMLVVVVGKGPDVNAGSILTFDISNWNSGMAPLTAADALNALHISTWALSNGFTDSNPFSVAWDTSGMMFISDAGANAVLKCDLLNNITVFDTFPQIQNVWTAFPPYIDYVPTKIISNQSGGFYLCNLTGFPFIGGISQVLSIDSAGMTSVAVTGISQAVDMQMDSSNGDLYILRFGVFDSTAAPIPLSAMITRMNSNQIMDTVLMNFGPSAGMALDSGLSFYVTDLLAGSVLHIENTTSIKQLQHIFTRAVVSPNPFHSKFLVDYTLSKSMDVNFSIADISGKEVYKTDLESQNAGRHTKEIAVNLAPGFYMLTISSPLEVSILKLSVY
jgi:hypothetical protein